MRRPMLTDCVRPDDSWLDDLRGGGIGQHPSDTEQLTRSEVWTRIFYGMLLGVSLGVATYRMDRSR